MSLDTTPIGTVHARGCRQQSLHSVAYSPGFHRPQQQPTQGALESMPACTRTPAATSRISQ